MTDGNKHPVLAEVVEITEEGERLIPATVRLESVDSQFSSGVHELYMSTTFGLCISGEILRERESTLLQDFGASAEAISVDQLITQVIKGAPKISHNVTSSS